MDIDEAKTPNCVMRALSNRYKSRRVGFVNL